MIVGESESIVAFSNTCKSNSVADIVYSSILGECIDASSGINIFQVVLTDSLMSSLQVSKLDTYKLGYVSGIIQSTEKRLVLDVIPFSERKARKSVNVGDVKLSELKKMLGSNGIPSVFIEGGVLIVNGNIVVRKSNASSIEVGGSVSTEYYRVRKLIYAMLAVL